MTEWIEDKYDECIKHIITTVKNEWKEQVGPSWFTPHGPDHNEAVERNIKTLCQPAENSNNYLSPLERFIASAAAWLHDMGMCPSVHDHSFRLEKYRDDKAKKEQEARAIHHLLSADYIKGTGKRHLFNVKDLLESNPNIGEDLSSLVAIVSTNHRRSEDLMNCPISRTVAGQSVRTRLLSALLRIADGIHITSERCSNIQYQLMMMAPMPWESQFHWMKSFSVSSIVPDHANSALRVQIDIPRSYGPSHLEWDRAARRLADYLRLELEEELDEVNKVLIVEKDFPSFWEVTCSIQEVPGYDEERAKQLWDVLRNKDIANSPNAGRVFCAVLETINDIINARISASEVLTTLTDFKERFVDRLLHERPCHVGLIRMQNMLTNMLNEPKAQETQAKATIKKLKIRLDMIKENLKRIQNNILDEKALNPLLNASNIFVFAYSSTVGLLLSYLPEPLKDSLNVFVAECRPKSKYTSNNRPLYLDCVEYAKMLNEQGMSRITIIPDLEVGTRLSRLNSDERKRTLILFGANGIQHDTGVFGYSAGHLMIAVTAKELKVPVWVITDSLKIGNFKPNRDLARGPEWFSTYRPTIAELDSRDILLSNLREDIISIDYLNLLITDKGVVDLTQKKDQVIEELTALSNKWDEVFGLS